MPKKKIQTWANHPEEASVSQPYSFTKQLPVVSSDKDFHGDLYPLLDREKQTQQDGPGKEAVAACPPWWGFLTSTQIAPPGIHSLLGPRKDQDTGCSVQKGSMAQQKDKSRCIHPGHGFAAQLDKVLTFL